MTKSLIAVFALASASLLAQALEQAPFYKLEFVVKEVEGSQTITSKTYSTMVSTVQATTKPVIRAGSRVAVPTGVAGTASAGQYTFSDVGTNIDVSNVRETPNGLTLQVTAEISTLLREPATPSVPPVTRQNRWSSDVVVAFKKTTLLFTSDDPGSKRQMQLELTATPIK